MDMTIQRTGKEIIIRLPASVETEGLQHLVDSITYLEATAKSKAAQSDVDALAASVKSGWWTKNRDRLIK